MRSKSSAAPLSLALILAGGLTLSDPADAVDALFGLHDRPGTPTDVLVKATGPYSVDIEFRNTASDSECVYFEFSTKINGRLVSENENPARDSFPQFDKRAGINCGEGRPKRLVRQLGVSAGAEYCFQIWSRRYPDGVRSDQPSGWACGRTPQAVPLKPHDVRAVVPSLTSTRPPRISWRTPIGSNLPVAVRFTVERQSPPGPNRPWLKEGSIPGPTAAQNSSAPPQSFFNLMAAAGTGVCPNCLAFSFDAGAVDPRGAHVYRVCAENDGGRTCSDSTALITAIDAFQGPALTGRTSVGVAGASSTMKPELAASLTPQTKANVLAEIDRTSQANSRPAAPPPAQPSSAATSSITTQQPPAASGVKTQLSPSVLAAAKKSVATSIQGGAQLSPLTSPAMTTTSSGSASGGAGGGGGRSVTAWPSAAAKPAAANISALVRESDLPRNLASLNDNAIIIVGGTQVRVGEVKQQVLQLDDNVQLRVGGHRVHAKRLKQELQRQQSPGNWANVPGNRQALNPQPLPPHAAMQTVPNTQFSKPGSALKQ
ncbi:MAG: hypothetical protein ACM3PU_04080 [Gemmatimonadota bacterium]